MAPSDAPPAYTQSAAQNIDTSELHKRQEVGFHLCLECEFLFLYRNLLATARFGTIF